MEFPFTNREVAIAILIAGFCAWVIRIETVHSSLKSLFKAALAPSLCIPFVFICLWISFGVTLLDRFGFWDHSLLKETIMWSLFTGVALTFNIAVSEDPNRSFGNNLGKQFKWAVGLSFFINLVAFPILIELPLIALMVIAGTLLEFAKSDEKSAILIKPLGCLLGILGFAVLASVVLSVLKTPSLLFSLKTAKSFLLPFLLILWTLPFAYLFAIRVAYESLFVRIDLRRWQERCIRLYTTMKILSAGKFNASRIKRINKLLGRKTDDLKDHGQVDSLFSTLRTRLRDPDNKDSRDFIWPEPQLLEGENRYSSLHRYLKDTSPLIYQLSTLWDSTTEAFSEFPDETKVPPLLEKFLISHWQKISELREKIDYLDRAPIIAEYFDQEMRMFSADLRQIYWYTSPENPSFNDDYRLSYIVFSNFKRAGTQFERLLRARRKLDAQSPLE